MAVAIASLRKLRAFSSASYNGLILPDYALEQVLHLVVSFAILVSRDHAYVIVAAVNHIICVKSYLFYTLFALR